MSRDYNMSIAVLTARVRPELEAMSKGDLMDLTMKLQNEVLDVKRRFNRERHVASCSQEPAQHSHVQRQLLRPAHRRDADGARGYQEHSAGISDARTDREQAGHRNLSEPCSRDRVQWQH